MAKDSEVTWSVMFVAQRHVDDKDTVVVRKRTAQDSGAQVNQARQWNEARTCRSFASDDVHGHRHRVPHWKAEVCRNVRLANRTLALATNTCKGLVGRRKCDAATVGDLIHHKASKSLAADERGGSARVDEDTRNVVSSHLMISSDTWRVGLLHSVIGLSIIDGRYKDLLRRRRESLGRRQESAE